MAMQWLGKVKLGLGALDTASNAQAKALLASFNTTDGQNCVAGYGLEAGDVDPNAWATRDGRALACFANWWHTNNKLPAIFPATGYTWIDLKAEHLQALQQWGLEKGVINPGQVPGPVNCALACQQKYATDPQNLATCLAICGAQAPAPAPAPTPAPPAPTPQPPLPTPPAPIPSPTPAPTESGLGVAGVLAIVGAMLGLGALILSR